MDKDIPLSAADERMHRDVVIRSRVRQERLRRGWSVARLASIAEINIGNLSLIERALFPVFPAWQQRIAQAFGMPIEDLFAVSERRVLPPKEAA